MAGLKTRCNALYASKNKLTEKAFIKGSDTFTSIPVAFKASIPALAPTLTATPGLLGRYMDKNL